MLSLAPVALRPLEVEQHVDVTERVEAEAVEESQRQGIPRDRARLYLANSFGSGGLDGRLDQLAADALPTGVERDDDGLDLGLPSANDQPNESDHRAFAFGDPQSRLLLVVVEARAGVVAADRRIVVEGTVPPGELCPEPAAGSCVLLLERANRDRARHGSTLHRLSGMIRPGTPQDARFLRDMLRHAYYWRSSGIEDESGLHPMRYVENWGRPGDAAVIALDEGFPVGAAWYRLFKEGAPGYGFVDELTPELSIAVVPSRRGHGFGGELMDALLARARADGYPAISLSVAKDSPSVRLYERYGFEKLDERDSAITMRAQLN
jgi:GNAT superfamily N-acetyltransferase